MSASQHARGLYHRARRMVHPCVERFLPVTYLPEEISERKRRLDPRGLRQRAEQNDETDGRIVAMASAIGIDTDDARRYLAEARRVQPCAATGPGGMGLASPMCFEDRYTTYVVTRALVPDCAVETGVANGVSSLSMLAAMEASGCGVLTSIEIEDVPGVGRLVPVELRSRWTVVFGDSLSVLPRLCSDGVLIDLFVHDSFHSYGHMWREFTLAWGCLRPGGVLLAHDVLENNAFPRFVRAHEREIGAWSRGVNCGLVRKCL